MPHPARPARRVAVVGSGVAGLTAAYVAAGSDQTGNPAHVTLYEADDRLGGHADTHDVNDPGGRLAIDTGFIVHNERTYPTLLRLFDELGVAPQESEMSMSIRDDVTGLEWAGALGPAGLFPTWRNLGRPAYLRMLGEVPRFHRAARRLLAGEGEDHGGATLREFLHAHGFTAYFARHFMEPVVAAVWSCDPAVALDYPARYLFTFLDHHGMLGVFGSPQWRTVVGGSRSYVDRVGALLLDVRVGTKVTSVSETSTGVEVVDGNGRAARYDAVVIATHPDQALAMLADPTATQRDVLGSLPYSANAAVLHTDESLLPRARRARASWNFRRVADDRGKVIVTYDLTRLMRLPTGTRYLLTLGGEAPRRTRDRHRPARVRTPALYPGLGGRAGPAARVRHRPDRLRRRLPRLGIPRGRRALGAGCRTAAGLPVGAPIGGRGASSGGDEPPHHVGHHPRGHRTTISHTRRRPWRRTFTHRSYTWLVDVGDLPDHGILARFHARDHLGWPHATIRGNLEAYLAGHGIDLTTPSGRGRVLMAALPRAFGHCFNPISVFWCFDGDARPAATVVEVHNTYGDRHAYLVHPDAQGRARTEKRMYVSPFHGVDGTYELAVPPPGDRLHVAVTLRTPDGTAFSASLAGDRLPRGDRDVALRTAPAGIRGALLIRMHGVWLWSRRLRVQPRPIH